MLVFIKKNWNVSYEDEVILNKEGREVHTFQGKNRLVQSVGNLVNVMVQVMEM